MKKILSPLRIGLLLSVVILLPSCTDWVKEKLGLQKNASTTTAPVAGGASLATANGKPFFTSEEFEQKYNNFIQNHPLGAMIAQMKGIKRKIFEGLLAQKLISDYVETHGLNKTKEYNDQLDQMKQMLNVRVFEMQNPVKPTDVEVKKFYEENKSKMPEATVSQGGVKATGVSFAKEADAKAFLDKAKGKGADLEKLAKDTTGKYQDFKVINKMSIGVDSQLKDKILAVAKAPSVELIKGGDNNWWVVYIVSKEEPKLRSFEELKPIIEQKLTAQKQEEANAKALEKLKAENKIVIDESYFAEDEKAAAQDHMAQVMPQGQAEQKAQKPSAKAA